MREFSLVELVRRVGPATVFIRTLDSGGKPVAFGSGFVASDGRVVTNAHVVWGAASVEVLGPDGQLLLTCQFAEALSVPVDVAVLPRLPRWSGPRLSLGSQPPEIGDRVVVFGAPEGLTNTVSDGILSAVRRLENRTLLQITAPISHGSSGGPVVNLRGQVLGLASQTLTEGQSLNFAVAAVDVRAMLNSPVGRYAFSPEPTQREIATSAPSSQGQTQNVPAAPSPQVPASPGPEGNAARPSTAIAGDTERRPEKPAAPIRSALRTAYGDNGPRRGTWLFVHSWRTGLGLVKNRSFIRLKVSDTVFHGTPAIVFETDRYVGDDQMLGDYKARTAVRARSFVDAVLLQPVHEEFDYFADLSSAPDKRLCYQMDYEPRLVRITTHIAENMGRPLPDVLLSEKPLLPMFADWAAPFGATGTTLRAGEFSVVQPFSGLFRALYKETSAATYDVEGVRARAKGFVYEVNNRASGQAFYVDEGTGEPTYFAVGSDVYARQPTETTYPDLFARDIRGGHCVFR